MISKIFLLLFLAFLIIPTIVMVIEKSSDISVFYSVSEEENIHKQIKVLFSSESSWEIITTKKLSSNTIILSENLSKHDNIIFSIFILPPKYV